MLDQNLTTLLSALLGGILSITGGIVANFYIQHATTNAERKKEIHSIIEMIYKDTQKALNCCGKLDGGPWLGHDIKTTYEDLESSIEEIEMLVDLYVFELKNQFDEYKHSMLEGIVISIKPDKNSPEYEVEEFPDVSRQEEATKKFRDAIRSVLQKNGTTRNNRTIP